MTNLPPHLPSQIIAFEGKSLIGRGSTPDVALAMKRAADRGPRELLLAFDARSSQPVDIDLRGGEEDVLRHVAGRLPGSAGEGAEAAGPKKNRGPGRPKLGVVSREVTLLPRHWDWLSEQPGGASVTLRKLVETARRADGARTSIRQAREAVYRFISAMAGDEPGFEEATRSLFAGDATRFAVLVEAWPPDVRDHARRLAKPAFEAPAGEKGASSCRT
ncbi:MAG: DUF2239 family protein [Acidobacteria bacterium]|nr:DUF2239 family protein [Acidobacteriota bacterium]